MILLLGWVVGCGAEEKVGGEVHVAVASNFAGAMEELARAYERERGVAVVVSAGSTGKHYAQIRNGAPFDVFFAADAERPRLLEEESVAVPGSRVTYAKGKLVLWRREPERFNSVEDVLASNFDHLAIANPLLAPYGRAAQQTLEAMGLWEGVQDRLVMGENIGQTFQYVATGNADMGFVAYSQIAQGEFAGRGGWWVVPAEMYAPIEQQAVLLTDSGVARGFFEYVLGDSGRAIIARYGYDVP